MRLAPFFIECQNTLAPALPQNLAGLAVTQILLGRPAAAQEAVSALNRAEPGLRIGELRPLPIGVPLIGRASPPHCVGQDCRTDTLWVSRSSSAPVVLGGDEILEAERSMTSALPRKAIEVDLSLHDALSGWLDNPLAAEVYRVNRDRIAVIQNTRAFLPDRIAPAMREHLAIIDALERRDADTAVAAIAEHCRMTLRWWGILV